MKYLKHFIILIVFSTTLLTACSTGEEAVGKIKDDDTNQVGKIMDPTEFADTFLAGDYEKIYSQMSQAFQDEVSFKQLKALADDFNKNVTTYILQSELPYGNDTKKYAWIDASSTRGMVAIFDVDNIIHGLQIMPLETFPETDNVYTETEMEFPFQDEWYVFWGGTNSLVNYHYAYENQRYAYDFVIMNESTSYQGDPTLNESYFAFGKKYLAPADGVVVEVENSVADNSPVGTMNEKEPLGNYVILDHGNNEYSYLAHFKYESITVKKGDKVKQGDSLGQVGNSGNSSEPHIHFHIADSPDIMTSKSINIKFTSDEEVIQGSRIKTPE